MISKIRTRPFDAANYLNDEEDVAAYLAAVMEEGDPALLAGALGVSAFVLLNNGWSLLFIHSFLLTLAVQHP